LKLLPGGSTWPRNDTHVSHLTESRGVVVSIIASKGNQIEKRLNQLVSLTLAVFHLGDNVLGK
jgi:hypothetical protein